MEELEGIKAVIETIRICKERNILTDYLESREQEVTSIMINSLEEERAMKLYIKCERHDEARKIAERIIKDRKLSLEEIAHYLPTLTMEELRGIEAERNKMRKGREDGC